MFTVIAPFFRLDVTPGGMSFTGYFRRFSAEEYGKVIFISGIVLIFP
jgi:hypothetical protein